MWKLGILDFINNVYLTSSTVFHSVMLGLHHNPQCPLFQRLADVFIFTAAPVPELEKTDVGKKKLNTLNMLFNVNVIIDSFVPPFLCCGLQHGGKLYL